MNGLLEGTEALNLHHRLYLGLKTALPVEAGALGNVEVGNLYGPACIRILARDRTDEG